MASTEIGSPPAASRKSQTIAYKVAVQMVHPYSVRKTCPHCKQRILTRVAFIPGIATWLVSATLGLCGCLCIYYLPFFVNGLKDAEHYCPNCNALLGVFHRL